MFKIFLPQMRLLVTIIFFLFYAHKNENGLIRVNYVRLLNIFKNFLIFKETIIYLNKSCSYDKLLENLSKQIVAMFCKTTSQMAV